MRECLEVVARLGEGVEVAKAEVGGGSVAAEGVEVAAADEDDLRHAESGGAANHRPHVVALRHVVHHHQALHRSRQGGGLSRVHGADERQSGGAE